MNIKENPLLIICLLSSITGLVLIYIAVANIQPKSISISEITPDLVGRAVTTSGYITYKRVHSAGHLFLTLSDDTDNIEIPLFSSFMDELKRTGITEENFSKGTRLTITGLVGEYNGQLQIQPRKASDIEFGE